MINKMLISTFYCCKVCSDIFQATNSMAFLCKCESTRQY